MSLESRFWAKVDKSGDCWLWIASTNGHGYGQIKVGGRKGRPHRAHRVAYLLEVGPIPEGLEIDHICHVRLCVRPTHLRLSTTKQNQENLSGPRTSIPSGTRGVYFVGGKTPWKGQVAHNGVTYYLGVFPTVSEAEEAVIRKRNELFTHNELDRRAK